MLRGFVALLLVANLAFFAWTQGWLDNVVGVRARGDREPERLANQVNPDSIVILPSASGAATGAASCLEAGPFNAVEVGAAEGALRSAAPEASWADVRTERPGVWLIYMGGFADREALLRKEEEIKRVRSEFEEVTVPGEGALGLSLGRFDDRGNAERALAQFQQHGIRTARVVQASAPTSAHMLRIEHVEPALAAQLAAVKSEALGKGFAACARGDGAR